MTMVETRGRLERLAREHLNMVYASALRQMKDPEEAADVTQAVFLVLQRKLPGMDEGVMLGAWLLRTTRYACMDAGKRSRRRLHHERQAARSEVTEMKEDISPLIDEAMDGLAKGDRMAIVMAYFQGRSHEEIAARLGIGTEAAHKRVQRAVEKLRGMLMKRGVRVPAAGIVAGLAMMAKPLAAPAAVEIAVINGIGGQASIVSQTIAKGTMMMMKVLQMKMGVLAVAGVALALAVGAMMPGWGQESGPASGIPAVPAIAPTATASKGIVAGDGGGFGVERKLTIFDAGGGHDFLADLDNITTLTPPKLLDRSAFGAFNWMEAQGGDVIYESAPSTQGLMGFDMAICPTDAASYDMLNAANVMEALAASTAGTPAVMSVRALPATFLFRTREGAVGVLQVTSLGQGPSSATLRMKMLTHEARDRAAVNLANLLLGDMEKQAAGLAGATAPEDVTGAVRSLKREAAAVGELMKGTAKPATWRLLESVTRVMGELVDDKETGGVADRVGDLQKALELAKKEVARVKAGG